MIPPEEADALLEVLDVADAYVVVAFKGEFIHITVQPEMEKHQFLALLDKLRDALQEPAEVLH